MKRIYLDNAATTPIDKKVAKIMAVCQEKIYGNAGSLHKAGQEAKNQIIKARKEISKILNCRAEEIVFTASGTESDNLAIMGVTRANLLTPGIKRASMPGVVVSAIEHHAVLNSADQLKREGFEISVLPTDKDGLVILDNLKKLIIDKTTLVSVIYANNEIGTIQPIKEISKILRETKEDRLKRGINAPIYFHTDACQAAGFLDLDVQKLGVDLLTINGSKIYGPKGTGSLFVRTGVKIEPIIFGGGQERGLRSGTENVPGIVALAEALKITNAKRKSESAREIKLRDYFIKEIFKKIPKIVLNGHPEKRLPNNINISFLDIEGEAMLLWLDKYGICVSTGSACDSQGLEPSHVILALGRPYEYANGALRFTLGRHTTKKELDYVLKILPKVVFDLRRISPVKVKTK